MGPLETVALPPANGETQQSLFSVTFLMPSLFMTSRSPPSIFMTSLSLPLVLFGFLLLIERSSSRLELSNLLLQTPTPFHNSGKTIELVSLSSPLLVAALLPVLEGPDPCWYRRPSRSTSTEAEGR